MRSKGKNNNSSRLSRLASVITILTAIYLNTMFIYCDAFDEAATAADGLIDKFCDLATKIFPLSMVILIICILITHDQRMMTAELKVGGGICVAYIALLIVKNRASFLETFTNLGIGGSIDLPKHAMYEMASVMPRLRI